MVKSCQLSYFAPIINSTSVTSIFMKRLFFILVLSFSSRVAIAQFNMDSLLHLVDKAIEKRPEFSKLKETRIDSLKLVLSKEQNPKTRYQLNDRLFNEYKHYQMDSALSVAKTKYAIAQQMNHKQLQYESRMNIAETLGKMGMYKETFDIMGQIGKSDLEDNLWGYYFHLYHSIYSLLFQSALSQEEKSKYKDAIRLYKDSLLAITDTTTLAYKLILNGKLIENKRYSEALTLLNQCFSQSKANKTEVGMIAYEISRIYEQTGKGALQEQYLAISALSDLGRAVKSYISLRKLAVVLYQQGDVERAYSYIKCAMEDATFCKARFRMIEISEMLPIIVATYNKKMNEEKSRLFKYLLVISILLIVLAMFIILMYKQLKKTSLAKQAAKNANEELSIVNTHLKEVNKKLAEADLVKETYIGYVFNLYSDYINKLEHYRIRLNQLLKAKKNDEAQKITSTGSLVTNEIKALYQNFDAVFLNLYPNFIEEFNSLLKNGEQIIPKSGDFLTPELRVFALIRLGISDSGKIAGFLHYSPQTVYNYRLRIKNKLAVSKEEFAEKIQQIGR